MENTFNLRNFLTENTLTSNSREIKELQSWGGKNWKNRKLLIELVEGLTEELESIEDLELWDDQTSNDWCHDAIEQFTSAAQSIIGETKEANSKGIKEDQIAPEQLENMGYSAGEKALMDLNPEIFNQPYFNSFASGFIKGFQDNIEASQDYAANSVED